MTVKATMQRAEERVANATRRAAQVRERRIARSANREQAI